MIPIPPGSMWAFYSLRSRGRGKRLSTPSGLLTVIAVPKDDKDFIWCHLIRYISGRPDEYWGPVSFNLIDDDGWRRVA